MMKMTDSKARALASQADKVHYAKVLISRRKVQTVMFLSFDKDKLFVVGTKDRPLIWIVQTSKSPQVWKATDWTSVVQGASVSDLFDKAVTKWWQ